MKNTPLKNIERYLKKYDFTIVKFSEKTQTIKTKLYNYTIYFKFEENTLKAYKDNKEDLINWLFIDKVNFKKPLETRNSQDEFYSNVKTLLDMLKEELY